MTRIRTQAYVHILDKTYIFMHKNYLKLTFKVLNIKIFITLYLYAQELSKIDF